MSQFLFNMAGGASPHHTPPPPAPTKCPQRPSPKPPTGAGVIEKRDYQRSAVDSVGRCLADSGSTLAVLATGLGKTVIIAFSIREHCPNRALVLAHRQELIDQNARTIERVLGEPCGIEMADRHADLPGTRKPKVVVASKDSLHPKRLERFDPAEFSLIVVDEAHHIGGSYQRVIDHFAGVPLLGVTATPDRHDEQALGQLYQTVAMNYGIAEGINDGWLVPIRAHTVFVQDLVLDGVRTVAGDFNQAELAEILEREPVLHEVAASITRECGDRRAIVFTASVRQATRLSDMLNDYIPGSSRWVCGETPKDQRAFDLAEHRRGAFKFIVNCGVLLEGYDDPGASMIVCARPTKSRPLFAQMLGRSTRALPGVIDGLPGAAARRAAIAASGKPDALILDFAGNCGRHRLVTPADILGGKYPDADIAAASAALAGGEGDVAEELEKARKGRESGSREVQAELEELRASRARIVALAKYLLKPEDLFDGMVTAGRERNWTTGKEPTTAQLDTLERAGFGRADAERMSRSECSKVIGEIITRRVKGLATLKQVRFLAARGVVDADKMAFVDANERIGRLMQRFR